MIRHPESGGGQGTKFASISAKVKAKQLARAAAALQTENGAENPTSTPAPRTKTEEGGGEPPSSTAAGGDDQIYYMLVDDCSQLENQTILIDESQLTAATSGQLLQVGCLIVPGILPSLHRQILFGLSNNDIKLSSLI